MTRQEFMRQLQTGLLGPSTDYGGLLDQGSLDAARRSGMMNFGTALLAAGGPSREPVSLGQALGSALQQGRAAQSGALTGTIQNKMMQAQLEQIKKAKRGELVPVIKDGMPQYAYAEDAVGAQPYSLAAPGQGSADLQAYNQAIKDGFKGTFLDFKRAYTDASFIPQYAYPEIGGVTNRAPTKAPPGTDLTPKPLTTIQQEANATEIKKQAEAVGTGRGKNVAESEQVAVTNKKAFDAYQASMSGLTKALEGTATGPIVGRAPAITAAQQTADKAVAAMAPTLKGLFRTAGEGTFTDKDQELLLNMIPRRTDAPEARNFAISNIDAIVRAKLGQGSFDEYYEALPVGAEFIGPDGRKRVKQ